jgi:hypothetical protein
VGKPNERERRYYYSASGEHKTTTNTHFQPRKIPHSTKTVPPNSTSFFVPNLYYCTNYFVPRFPCQQSVVRTVSYNPEIMNINLKSALKFVPKTASIFVPNPYYCTELYILYRSVQYDLPQQKNNSTQKSHNFFSWDSCPSSLENVPSLLLTFLSQAYSKNLSCSSGMILRMEIYFKM